MDLEVEEEFLEQDLRLSQHWARKNYAGLV